MTRIYISDNGENDGRTRETAIYSWTRAVKLCDENTETNLMQGDATLQRLTEEIERRKKNGKGSRPKPTPCSPRRGKYHSANSSRDRCSLKKENGSAFPIFVFWPNAMPPSVICQKET